MAEFPIFEGTGGGAETTVRTSRIGPEPPEAKGTEEAAKALYGIGAIFAAQDHARQQLLVSNGKASLEGAMTAWQAEQDQKGYNAKWQEDYNKTAQDTIKHIQSSLAAEGAHGLTMSRFLDEANMYIAGRLPAVAKYQTALNHRDIEGRLDQELMTRAMHSTVGDGDEQARTLQGGMDSIDTAQKNGVFNEEVAFRKKQTFMQTVAREHAEQDIANNPTAFLHKMLDFDNLGKDPIYGHLTPQMHEQMVTRANTAVKQRTEAGHLAFQQEENDHINAWHQHQLDGTLTPAYMENEVRHYPHALGPMYRAATGLKPPADELSPERAFYYKDIADSIKSPEDMRRFQEQVYGDRDVPVSSRALLFAHGDAALDRYKTDRGVQVEQWKAEFGPAMDRALGITPGTFNMLAGDKMMSTARNRIQKQLAVQFQALTKNPNTTDKDVREFFAGAADVFRRDPMVAMGMNAMGSTPPPPKLTGSETRDILKMPDAPAVMAPGAADVRGPRLMPPSPAAGATPSIEPPGVKPEEEP